MCSVASDRQARGARLPAPRAMAVWPNGVSAPSLYRPPALHILSGTSRAVEWALSPLVRIKVTIWTTKRGFRRPAEWRPGGSSLARAGPIERAGSAVGDPCLQQRAGRSQADLWETSSGFRRGASSPAPRKEEPKPQTGLGVGRDVLRATGRSAGAAGDADRGTIAIQWSHAGLRVLIVRWGDTHPGLMGCPKNGNAKRGASCVPRIRGRLQGASGVW